MESFFPLPVNQPERKEPVPIQVLTEPSTLREKVIAAIKTVYDPEIPVDIYELGLIYEVNIKENNHVEVVMTLTSPGCFAAAQIPSEVEQKIVGLPEIESVHVELTFEPPWDKAMMSEAALLDLGFW
jgi:FeS assembly SUF system protein